MNAKDGETMPEMDEPIDEESAAALTALKRARKRAEELARRTGTDLIQAVDGKPVRIPPPKDAERP